MDNVTLRVVMDNMTLRVVSNGIQCGAMIATPPGLNENTLSLVVRFAEQMAIRLREAEIKHRYSDNWATCRGGDADALRERLIAHVARGDAIDVAIYSAFLWHHGEAPSLAPAYSDDLQVTKVIAEFDEVNGAGWPPPTVHTVKRTSLGDDGKMTVWINAHPMHLVAPARLPQAYAPPVSAPPINAADNPAVDDSCPYGNANCDSADDGKNCAQCASDIATYAPAENYASVATFFDKKFTPPLRYFKAIYWTRNGPGPADYEGVAITHAPKYLEQATAEQFAKTWADLHGVPYQAADKCLGRIKE